MIPWMREKFAERKAKWEASRKRTSFLSDNIGISDKIPLQREVSRDPIEIFESRDTDDEDTITLNIINYDGRIAKLRCSPLTTTIKDVKLMAVKKFKILQTDDQDISFQNYKLSKAANVMLNLSESLSIRQIDLSDHDELLLIRLSNNEIIRRSDYQKGPSQREIDKLTTGRIACGEKSISSVNINEIVLHCDVKSDIRKLLISLAKSSAFVIGSSPFATKIILMFKQRLIRRNANNLYLLESLSQFQMQNKLRRDNIVSDIWLQRTENLPLNEQSSKAHFSHSLINEATTKSNVQALLEIIRIYSYKHITPKSNFEEVIWEMGFNKDEVNEALTINENNYAEACKWLMRTQVNHNNGLLKDSPILKALLTSPHIQLSFSCPKTFIAYLSILDNYASINLWLSDVDTHCHIGHILRTYHEEKHILAINQIS